MNTDKARLIDLVYVKLKGLQVRIKDFFILRSYPDLQVALMENTTEDKYAKGLRLRFSLKGFDWCRVASNGKSKKPINEITYWLDIDNAKKLKAFLIKNIDEMKGVL